MKVLHGTITSLKNTNTARVRVVRSWQHPLYKKFVKRSKSYLCDYSDMQLMAGDTVEIQECAPISKLKHFKVVAKVAAATAQSIQEAAAVTTKATKSAKTTKEKNTKETK